MYKAIKDSLVVEIALLRAKEQQLQDEIDLLEATQKCVRVSKVELQECQEKIRSLICVGLNLCQELDSKKDSFMGGKRFLGQYRKDVSSGCSNVEFLLVLNA